MPQPPNPPDPSISQELPFEIQGLGLNVQLGFFTQVTGFSSQVDVLEYPEGGRNDFVHRLPTRVKQGNITLKRGVVTREGAARLVQEDRRRRSKPTNLSITSTTPSATASDLELRATPTRSSGRARPQRGRHRDHDRVARDRPHGMTVQAVRS